LKNILFKSPYILLTNKHGDEKVIGELYDSTFVTQRDPDKHLMRRWDAYGINAELIDSGDIETIIIVENGKNQFVTAADVKTHGRYHKEEGHDAQYFIPRERLAPI
jgi:hypothetical protein